MQRVNVNEGQPWAPEVGVCQHQLVYVHTWVLQTTDVLWAGMAPAMALGALFSYLRLRYFRVTVVGRFARAKPGTKPKYIHK
jgi:hypothetical protein